MNHIADGAQAPPSQELPTGELVKQLSEQVSMLVREELKLAQLEMTRKGKQAGGRRRDARRRWPDRLVRPGLPDRVCDPGHQRGTGGVAAALIMGVALLAVARVAALMGKSRLHKATPPVPKETVDSVKADVDVIKERARR
jgi:Putative Actinobacterial Holin-X, holin superfamily III